MHETKPVTFATSRTYLSIQKANPDNTFISGNECWYLRLSPAGDGASTNPDDALLLCNSSTPGLWSTKDILVQAFKKHIIGCQYDVADTALVGTKDGLNLARARRQCDQSPDLYKSHQEAASY